MNLCIAIVGPTAAGKSSFSVELAKLTNAEIVSLDATAVYRGFDIGAAKPDKQAQAGIVHHMLDIFDPEEECTAFDFISRADQILTEIQSRGKLPLVVGGSNFYLRALQFGMFKTQAVPQTTLDALEQKYIEDERLNTQQMHADLAKADPASAKKIHPNDAYRLIRALSIIETTGTAPSTLQATPISEAQRTRRWIKYSMTVPRHQINSNIVARTDKMLHEGLIEETRQLLSTHPKAKALGSIGYAECQKYIQGELNIKQLKNEIIEKTRQLAKRQFCWVRSDPEMRFISTQDLNRVRLEINNLKFALGDKGGS